MIFSNYKTFVIQTYYCDDGANAVAAADCQHWTCHYEREAEAVQAVALFLAKTMYHHRCLLFRTRYRSLDYHRLMKILKQYQIINDDEFIIDFVQQIIIDN